MTDSDITILGAGPVGATLALLLASRLPDPGRLRLCRVARPHRPADQADSAVGVRALALNHGSRTLLESLGAWPNQGAAIHTIHVSQRGRLGRTLIRHTDFDVPELGTVHAYDRLATRLDQALATSGVQVVEGPAATITGETGKALKLAQGEAVWTSRLVVQAEGGSDSAPAIERDYDQHAILATVRADAPREGWAWERFTRDGPLALLPLRLGTTGTTHSLVWCCRPAQARELLAASADDFAHALNTAFGTRLGRLEVTGPRLVQPLRLRWRRDPLGPRRLAIGNAAQTLHPVAGQGLNLGLRDAAQLAHALGPWLARPTADPMPTLRQFAGRRQADRLVTGIITDFLPRVFSTGLPPVEHACGLALLALDTLPGLRAPLTRQLLLGLRS
ncbi:MAG: FAD-dependent monooxygenase [Pigmentiphaga sp.]